MKYLMLFDETDIFSYELDKYNPRTVNKINIKNEILEYLKIMDWKLIDMISYPAFVRKIKHANYKGYVNKKLNKIMIVEINTSLKQLLILLNLKS